LLELKMPLYEYQCTNCGKNCEILQKMNETVVTCPHCGKDQLQRQVSAPSFQLKGTGWYVTDFKNKDKGAKPVEKESDATPASKESSEKPATDAAKPTQEKES
jgi:putative FmdB family regulatory protein